MRNIEAGNQLERAFSKWKPWKRSLFSLGICLIFALMMIAMTFVPFEDRIFGTPDIVFLGLACFFAALALWNLFIFVMVSLLGYDERRLPTLYNQPNGESGLTNVGPPWRWFDRRK